MVSGRKLLGPGNRWRLEARLPNELDRPLC